MVLFAYSRLLIALLPHTVWRLSQLDYYLFSRNNRRWHRRRHQRSLSSREARARCRNFCLPSWSTGASFNPAEISNLCRLFKMTQYRASRLPSITKLMIGLKSNFKSILQKLIDMNLSKYVGKLLLTSFHLKIPIIVWTTFIPVGVKIIPVDIYQQPVLPL